jgi:hypothetical protein
MCADGWGASNDVSHYPCQRVKSTKKNQNVEFFWNFNFFNGFLVSFLKIELCHFVGEVKAHLMVYHMTHVRCATTEKQYKMSEIFETLIFLTGFKRGF